VVCGGQEFACHRSMRHCCLQTAGLPGLPGGRRVAIACQRRRHYSEAPARTAGSITITLSITYSIPWMVPWISEIQKSCRSSGSGTDPSGHVNGASMDICPEAWAKRPVPFTMKPVSANRAFLKWFLWRENTVSQHRGLTDIFFSPE
jgi:hypothetical protein